MTTEKKDIKIRLASVKDAQELLKIYAPYVTDTAVTFEYQVPQLSDFEERITHTLERFPYLLAVSGKEILGYAYAGPFHSRAAYAWAAETSIYVNQSYRQMGIGKKLYQALEQLLALQNILNLNACIACPEKEDEYLTRDSLSFHRKMGFHTVGHFHRCGYKFGRWYDMVWMEKHLAPHPPAPRAVKPFPEVRDQAEELLGISQERE